MAVLNLARSSKILSNQTNVVAILPDEIKIQAKIPVIWLFHGLGDNGTCWLRKTSLERIASKYNVAVIMPDMQRSFYTNTASNVRYWDYLTQELIPQMQRYFPLSQKASENYLVGNSMGGYGVLKLAANFPDKFSAVAAISPVTNLKVVKDIMPDYQAVFDDYQASQYQLESMFKKADLTQLKLLRWYVATGNDDFMKNDCDKFTQFLTKDIGLNLIYDEQPGSHNWDFWDMEIAKIFEWLPLGKI
jgi:S-formylglutathione hydrolase FrmB